MEKDGVIHVNKERWIADGQMLMWGLQHTVVKRANVAFRRKDTRAHVLKSELMRANLGNLTEWMITMSMMNEGQKSNMVVTGTLMKNQVTCNGSEIIFGRFWTDQAKIHAKLRINVIMPKLT